MASSGKRWRIGLLAPRAFHFYAHEIVEGMRAARIGCGQRILPVDLLYHQDSEIPELLAGCELDAIILGLDHGRYQLYHQLLPVVPMINVHPDLLAPEIPTIAIKTKSLAEATLDYFSSLGIRNVATVHASITEAQQRVNRHLKKGATDSGGSFQSFELPGFGIIKNYQKKRTLPELKEFDDWLLSLEHPTGLLTSGGFSAVTAIHSATRIGLGVPDSLSVLSRSDDNVCLFNDPPVSSFRSVGAAIGELALAILIKHLNGDPLPQGELGLPAPSIIERDSTGVPAGIERSLSAAVRFIRRNALQGITVDDLIEAIPTVSRSQLYRFFEQQFGRTPAQEIQRLRIAEAKSQLRFSRKSLTEIADHCSFRTLAHFSTVFSRETGLSPRIWREKNRIQD